MFLVIMVSILDNELVWHTQEKPVADLTRAMGYNGLSLSSECLSTRNPILEYTCLTDIPGGYCYHDSCAMVGPVSVGQEYHIKVIHP